MPFNWEEYLRLAEQLLVQSRFPEALDHARARCAIGRAYYAAAMTARDQLRSEGIQFGISRSVHQQVITELEISGDAKRVRAAKLLIALRRERNRADYDERYDPGNAKDLVASAAQCISLVKIQSA